MIRAAAATVLLLSACAAPARPPAMLFGGFVDDYGSSHTVNAHEWIHESVGRYRVERWYPERQFLIAQNDSGNTSAPGLWTRIDWVELSDMAPYTWAFCYSAWEAPSAAAAESTTVARKDTPRTGCNGYPFTRMAPAAVAHLK